MSAPCCTVEGQYAFSITPVLSAFELLNTEIPLQHILNTNSNWVWGFVLGLGPADVHKNAQLFSINNGKLLPTKQHIHAKGRLSNTTDGQEVKDSERSPDVYLCMELVLITRAKYTSLGDI